VQWDKMLRMLEKGVKDGLERPGGAGKVTIGGASAEGKAARVRVELEVQNIVD
jgi:nucleoporin GLE1